MTPLAPHVPDTALAPRPQDSRAQLAAAAKQFEAIFVRQMLSAARKSDFGGEALFGGEGMDTFRQMQDDRFAEIASQRGALGLAKMIETHLARFVAPGKPEG